MQITSLIVNSGCLELHADFIEQDIRIVESLLKEGHYPQAFEELLHVQDTAESALEDIQNLMSNLEESIDAVEKLVR